MNPNQPNHPTRARTLCRRLAAGLALLALGACSALSPGARPPPAFYALEAPPAPAGAVLPSGSNASTRTLIINPPQAAAGFDSPRIIYVRYHLDGTPPTLANALAQTRYGGVVAANRAVQGALADLSLFLSERPQ